MSADLKELESILGHSFQDRKLLERALTHKSRSQERESSTEDNERLEFLGDSILGFVTSDYLVRLHPDLPEGPLSKRKAHFVSAERLYEAARRLDLGKHLRLGKGEELSGGRSKRALLADAVEAIIAALYLDAGLEVARSFVETNILVAAEESSEEAPAGISDHKSALQELAQARKLPQPKYVTVSTSGPDHSKSFLVEVLIGESAARAEGNSKKAAGQRAAEQLLAKMR